MNLRGSAIKAALAQLSQRCEVILVRLTDEQIEHHIRRKPLQNLGQNSIQCMNKRHDKKRKLVIELFGEDVEEDVASKKRQVEDGKTSHVSIQSSLNDKGLGIMHQNRISEETAEPFFRISGTFSLPNTCFKDIPSIDFPNVSNNVKKLSTPNSSVEEHNIKDIKTSRETGLTQNQPIQESEICESNEPKSKVGTIRVKNLCLLIDPKFQPVNSQITLETNDSFNSHSNANLSMDPTTSIEEKVVASYRHHFNELVEAKIPKLGDLLYLALGDAMRFHKTVSKANKLSSQELIIEECKRAENDYNHKMKYRGIEFHFLCETIVETFDASSKKTLFIALFCRILYNVNSIDPANEGHVKEAATVILEMLETNQYKDQDIIGLMKNDPEQFENLVEGVQKVIAKCFPGISNYRKSPTISHNSNNVLSCIPPASSQNSQDGLKSCNLSHDIETYSRERNDTSHVSSRATASLLNGNGHTSVENNTIIINVPSQAAKRTLDDMQKASMAHQSNMKPCTVNQRSPNIADSSNAALNRSHQNYLQSCHVNFPNTSRKTVSNDVVAHPPRPVIQDNRTVSHNQHTNSTFKAQNSSLANQKVTANRIKSFSVDCIRNRNTGTIQNPSTTSLTITTSHLAPTTGSPTTSTTAEANLPSSSHCHPYIARRPISGNMKMIFDPPNN